MRYSYSDKSLYSTYNWYIYHNYLHVIVIFFSPSVVATDFRISLGFSPEKEAKVGYNLVTINMLLKIQNTARLHFTLR